MGDGSLLHAAEGKILFHIAGVSQTRVQRSKVGTVPVKPTSLRPLTQRREGVRSATGFRSDEDGVAGWADNGSEGSDHESGSRIFLTAGDGARPRSSEPGVARGSMPGEDAAEFLDEKM